MLDALKAYPKQGAIILPIVGLSGGIVSLVFDLWIHPLESKAFVDYFRNFAWATGIGLVGGLICVCVELLMRFFRYINRL
jgi:hypothetical protein